MSRSQTRLKVVTVFLFFGGDILHRSDSQLITTCKSPTRCSIQRRAIEKELGYRVVTVMLCQFVDIWREILIHVLAVADDWVVANSNLWMVYLIYYKHSWKTNKFNRIHLIYSSCWSNLYKWHTICYQLMLFCSVSFVSMYIAIEIFHKTRLVFKILPVNLLVLLSFGRQSCVFFMYILFCGDELIWNYVGFMSVFMELLSMQFTLS